MIKRADILQAGFEYLDSNGFAEKLVIVGLAAIVSHEDIGREFKNNYMRSHKDHLKRGNLDGSSAALHLAAGVNDGMARQEKTFERKMELVHGVVLTRRSTLKCSLA